MKKLSFLALAAVGLLFGACSSDRDVVDVKSNDISNGGDQFISLSINLPTTPVASTRSENVTDDNNYENDPAFELNDGLAREYNVKDALLVVFRPAGNSEDDATFVGAYQINTNWNKSSDQQVTRFSNQIVQKVGGDVAQNDLLLVILNRNSLFTFTPSNNTFSVTGKDALVVGTSTFGDFRNSLLSTTKLGAEVMTGTDQESFFMTNAPLTDVAGSSTTEPTGATVRTLVPIKHVYQTEAEALASKEPALIYVERGMAKVTLQPFTEKTLDSDPNKVVTFIEWTLDQTNNSSYVVRSTEDHNLFVPLHSQVNGKYRYIGMSPITESTPLANNDGYAYRTYFAKDPNYNEDVAATDFSYAVNGSKEDGTGDYTSATGDENPQYCFENTFDVERQKVMNTTLVRIKVQVADDPKNPEDLYIIRGNRGDILLKGAVETEAKNAAIDYVQNLKTAGTINYTGTLNGDCFDVTIDKDPKNTDASGAGKQKITVTTTNAFEDLFAGENKKPTADEISAAVNSSLADVMLYKGGVSYYTIRIKHFGNQLTPWHVGNGEDPLPVVGDIYPGWRIDTNATKDDNLRCDNNYLGRYGVLRNNWYDINVNSIKYLGEATPKDYSNDPTTDDELDGYIAAKIHILSWAKRTSSWDL